MTEEQSTDQPLVEGAEAPEPTVVEIDMAEPVQEEVPKAPQPHYYTISVEREEQTTEYSPVQAFQVQGPLLMMDINKNTTLVPIVGDGVLSVDIIPVYLEGV